MNADKLNEVIAIVQQSVGMSVDDIRACVNQVWPGPERDLHTKWLETASAGEIAAWVISDSVVSVHESRMRETGE